MALKEVLRNAMDELLPPIASRAMKAGYSAFRRRDPTLYSAQGIGRSIRHRNSKADLAVLQQIFVHRDYDLSLLRKYADIQAFYDRQQRPLIVDCGANIGASSVWFCSQFPRATVIAVEPEADNVRLLTQNTAGLDTVVVHGAIAGAPGVVDLFDPGEGEWAYTTCKTGAAISSVPAYTLRQLMERATGASPFLLKIDIEGAEGGLFNDASFSAFPVVIVELHDWLLPGQGASKPFLRWHVQQDRTDFVCWGENVFSIDYSLLSAERLPEP